MSDSDELYKQLRGYASFVDSAGADMAKTFAPPAVETKTEGEWIYTSSGDPILDASGAGGIFGLGFRHPRVVKALCSQLESSALSSRTFPVLLRSQLVQKLCELTGPRYYVKGDLLNSGTEAMEAALKLARVTTKKNRIISFSNCYHGMSLATIAMSDIEMWREGLGEIDRDNTILPYDDIPSLEEAMGQDVAAVVVEPIQWASGCRVASQAFLEKARELCDRYGSCLIFDEIQCGMGRVGRWLASSSSGVKADLIALGKILSGGVFPIGVTLMNRRVKRAVAKRQFFNNSSYGGNPLACAVALETIEILEEGVLEEGRELGERLGQFFQDLEGEYPDILLPAHGEGLMRCMEFRNTMQTIQFFSILLYLKGVMVGVMSHDMRFVRVSLPLNLSQESWTLFADACRESLEMIKGTPSLELNRQIFQVASIKEKEESF